MNIDRPVFIRGLLALLLVAHFAWIAGSFEPALFSPDAHGYLLQARLLATEGRTWFVPESDLQQIGVHWYEAENGRYYSHYPFGMPALAALLYWSAGPAAAFLVNVVLATLTLLGFFLLCRFWVGERWALIAVAAMAVNPVFNEHALNKDAHLATACCLVWGLYLLGNWAASRSPGTAFVAGLVWGFLPAVRYPAALYGLVPLLFLLFDRFSGRWSGVSRFSASAKIDPGSAGGPAGYPPVSTASGPHACSDRRTWQGYLAMAAGALIPVGVLLWHNQTAFGAFWKTGYSLTNEQTAFSPGYFVQHFVAYVRGLHSEGAGLFFALGVAGAAALWARVETRRLGLLLTAALVPITALYMAYYWSGGGPGQAGASMRFLVPTFFLYTLAGVFLLRCLADQWPAHARVAVPMLLLFHAVWGIPSTAQLLRQAEQNGARQIAISRWIGEKVEPGSLVIGQTRIQEQLGVTGDWRLVDERFVGGDADRGPFLRPRDEQRNSSQVGPRVANEERLRQYRDLTPGERRAQLAADLSAWAGTEHRVYWVVPEEEFQNRRRALEQLATFAVIDSLGLPGEQIRERLFGPGGDLPGPPGGMGRMPDVNAAGGADRMRGMGMPGMRGAGMRSGPQAGKLLLVEWTLR